MIAVSIALKQHLLIDPTWRLPVAQVSLLLSESVCCAAIYGYIMHACSSHNKCINYNGLASNTQIVVYNNSIVFFQFVRALSVQYGISRECNVVWILSYKYHHTLLVTLASANRIFIRTLLAGKKIPPIYINDRVVANRPRSRK